LGKKFPVFSLVKLLLSLITYYYINTFLNGQNPSVFYRPFYSMVGKKEKGERRLFRNLPKTVWLVVYVCRNVV